MSRDRTLLTWLLPAVAVVLMAPSIVEVVAVERINHAVLAALLLDSSPAAGWIAGPQLSPKGRPALLEAERRYQHAAARRDWRGRSRLQGVLALVKGDRRMAATAFASSDDLLSRFWGAKIAAADKRYDDAARLLARDYPTLKLLQEKASAARARGDAAETSASLEIAARAAVDDRDVLALISRGRVRLVIGTYDSALNDFNRALAVCPDCYQAHLYRGQTWLAQGLATQDAVEQELRRAVTLAPQDREAALTWAQWLLNVHRWDEAEAAFQIWHERYPEELESVWNLAFIYCHTGRAQEGQSLMRHSLDRIIAPKTQKDRITELGAQCPG